MAKFFSLNTGAKIPSVGLGTWQAEPDAVGRAVVTAVKAGYRHIDCAAIYGNEEEIGLALKKLFDEGVVKREEMFISSKLWCAEHAPEDVPVALESSLKRLQLDYLDLYLIHWPFRLNKGTALSTDNVIPSDVPSTWGAMEKLYDWGKAKAIAIAGTALSTDNVIPSDIPSTWGAMEKLYDSGKAKAIGVSNFSSKKLEDLLAIARVPPAVNQVECHPAWQQQKLRSLCESKGVHLSAYSPLASPGTKWIGGNVLGHPVVVEVAEKLGKTPAQVALRWGIQMGNGVLPKSTNESRILANLDIFDWSIPEDLLAKFSGIEQVRLVSGGFFVKPDGIYKSVEELWDGEI